MTIVDDKRHLRNDVLAIRDALAPDFRAQASRSIAERIQGLPAYRDARVVLLTLPFRTEWDTRLVAAQVLEAGKTLAVPRIDVAARMLRPLRVRDLATDIESGYRGVPEPREGCEAVALAAIDAGAEDVDTSDPDHIDVFTSPGDLETVRKALEGAGLAVESAESAMVARNTVELDSTKARQALRMVELLEDLDDVQRVTANFDIPEDVFAEVAG